MKWFRLHSGIKKKILSTFYSMYITICDYYIVILYNTIKGYG